MATDALIRFWTPPLSTSSSRRIRRVKRTMRQMLKR